MAVGDVRSLRHCARDYKPGLIFHFFTFGVANIQAGLTFKRGLHFLSEKFCETQHSKFIEKA